jgi:hypothetical protein
MRSVWIILVAGTVVVITACFQFPKEESITTIFPKGYARPVALDKGNWKTGYNFALGEALQQAEREDIVTEKPVIQTIVIPYAPGKNPMANPTANVTSKKKGTVAKAMAREIERGEKKLRRLVAKFTKRNTKRQSNDVMLSATGR